MVKPPKSMRPESVADMSKAGRAQTKAFQDSSFHTYMARKIYLQRKQFGLVVPPPPPTQPPDINQELFFVYESKLETTPKQSSQYRVRFSSDGHSGSVEKSDNRCHGSDASSPENSLNSPKLLSSSSKKRHAPSAVGLGGLLKRLKRRHGDVPVAAKAPTREETGAASTPSTAASCAFAQAPVFSNPSLEMKETVSLHKENAQQVDAYLSMSIPAQSIQDAEKPTASSSPPVFSSAVPPPEISSSRRRLNRQRRQRSSEDGTTTSSGGDNDREDRPDLFFRGVVVLINGYTEPDAGTLQRMLHRHGGSVEKYETDHVTAVIASELSFAKAEVYRNMTRKPLPVITPAWIVDSVRAQALLPYQDYILGRMRINKYGGTVQSIQRYFASSKAATPSSVLNCSVATSATDTSRTPALLTWKGQGQVETVLVERAERLAEQDLGMPADFSETSKPTGNDVIDLTNGDFDDNCGIPQNQSQSDGERSWDRGVDSTNGAVTTARARQPDLPGQTESPAHTFTIDQRHSEVSCESESAPLVVEAANDTLHLPGTPSVLEIASREHCNPEGDSAPPNLLVSLAQTQESYHEDEDDEKDIDVDDVSPVQSIAESPNKTPIPSLMAHVTGQTKSVKDRAQPSSRADDKYINGKLRTVGTDPNFLENFFSKSRLSFIGSFKQRARSSPEKSAKMAKEPPTNTLRWVFHVDIDSFFASVVLRDYPQYRDKPVVVSHQGSDDQRTASRSSTSTSECATCNYKVSIETGKPPCPF
jgi:BRCT domain, a BRCA1 C-terminus domain